MRNPCVVTTALLVSVAFATASRAEDKRQWELEIHGGGLLSSSPQGGQAQLPAAGASFSVFGGRVVTRHVPSWYFGDGSALFNQVADVFPTLLQRVTPLDSALQRSALAHGTSGSLGLRVSRRVSRRLTAEVSVDYGLAQTKLSDASQAGVEASRASFISAWNRFLGSQVKSVTSVVNTSGGTRSLLTSAAVNVNLAPGHMLEPYATLGGGLISEQGKELAVSLAGDYQFTTSIRLTNGTALTGNFRETDTVVMRFPGGSAPFGLLGLGVKCRITPRLGVRVDVREHLYGNKARTLVDATPSTTPQGSPFSLSLSVPGASIAFSNSATTGSSTLSAPALAGFETFKGTGLRSQVSVTVGLFVRL